MSYYVLMKKFIKNFVDWLLIKGNIDKTSHKPPFFNEGEIWWCYVGENIGNEISGKGCNFTRPILIIKKLDKFSFIGIPLTTKYKYGTWYFNFEINGINNYAILSQVRYCNYRRMDKILFTLDTELLILIKSKFMDLFTK